MPSLPADLGRLSHLEAVGAVLGDVAGLKLLDIGCGDSSLPRDLAERGADCTGVDPFMPAQDWTPAGGGRWRILQMSAASLPLPDASIDAALFVYSLHHVPAADHAGVFRDLRRVLKAGGRLYVAEPLARGDFNDVLATFHDESAVREGAQRALGEAGRLFGSHAVSAYTDRRLYPAFEDFATKLQANTRFNDYHAEDVVAPSVRERFAAVAARTGGTFDQPVKIDLFG